MCDCGTGIAQYEDVIFAPGCWYKRPVGPLFFGVKPSVVEGSTGGVLFMCSRVTAIFKIAPACNRLVIWEHGKPGTRIH